MKGFRFWIKWLGVGTVSRRGAATPGYACCCHAPPPWGEPTPAAPGLARYALRGPGLVSGRCCPIFEAGFSSLKIQIRHHKVIA